MYFFSFCLLSLIPFKKTIYLLLDIMYSFPNKTDTPIESFPTAFAISWGQVKLVQGFWLLDHNDYEVSILLGI